MKKNPGSLTFPSNPLATMRELQDLDAPPTSTTATHEPVATHESVIVTPEPVVLAPPAEDAIGLANTTDNTVVHTTSSIVALPTSSDPLRTALLQTIQHPIAGDMSKGPFSVSSIKVHNTVWERLGYVAQLTGRNKQDLISEALLDLFVKIAHEEGEH
jgi:hypothetical protein